MYPNDKKMCYIPDVTQTEVRGFIPDIFTVVKKGAVGNTQSTHCLSVDPSDRALL